MNIENLQQRTYYKIFTNRDQEESHNKIHLGYQASTTEIILKKDNTTFFHVPFFSQVQNLSASNLAFDGAVPGPIPAAADRIFKNLKGDLENNTPWGQPKQRQDGTWLCSWLYALSSETPQWMDRFYNPGYLSYEEALEGGLSEPTYYKNNPVYYDVPSTLTLEPGVWYQYYHQGEKTAQEFVNTFSGNDNKNLQLYIDDWSCLCPNNPKPVDKSIYKNEIITDRFSNDWIKSVSTPGYTDRSVLSFNHSDFINCKVIYNNTYNNKNEFTFTFWVNSLNWSESPGTQLAGNLNKGGYSIFFDNLKYYPYFVVPENTYGHFFYFNNESKNYFEKNNQLTIGQPASFIQNSFNGNSQLISLERYTRKLYKYDHLGTIQSVCRDINNNTITLEGEPKLLAIDRNNQSIVVTTSGTYIFDQDLIFNSFDSTKTYHPNLQICFDGFGNLQRNVCRDIKYTNNNEQWFINLIGQVLVNGNHLTNIPEKATNIHIDPNGNVWILTETNHVYIINSETKELLKKIKVGVTPLTPDTKNISFIYFYDRNTGNKEWNAIIYFNQEKTVYFLTLDGLIKTTTYLPQNLNILDPTTAEQNVDFMTFTGAGDFTGYEWKRIFNKVLYNNKPQLQFKLSGNPPSTNNRNTIYTLSVPVDKLANKEWHLVTAVLRNKTYSLYIDNNLRKTAELPSTIDLTYTFKNNFYIGCPNGRTENLNKEINSQALIWDGYIDTIRIYNYALPEPLIQFFIKEKIIGDDLYWNITTAPLQYIETIERFFKHRAPGFKSNFFKLKINGLNITDSNTRLLVENNIKEAIQATSPINTELLAIEWVD